MKPADWDVESIRGHFVFPTTGRIVTNNAASTQPARELLELIAELAPQYDNVHRGYDTTYVKRDPHRLVPVDVARELEASGAIGKLHETVYSTTGVATTLAHSARMGREIAEKLRAAGVDAVILTST